MITLKIIIFGNIHTSFYNIFKKKFVDNNILHNNTVSLCVMHFFYRMKIQSKPK